MRTLLAGLFVFTVMLIVVGLIGRYSDGNWPWWAGPLIIISFFGSIFASLFLFNKKRWFRPLFLGKTLEEQIAELEQNELLVSETFRARRAFQLEEFEDEGSHYFIELDDGRTLYLNGQYLYDYEPIGDDPELNQSRKFPCKQFTIRRHKKAQYVVDILCSGDVIEPEAVAPHYDKLDWKKGVPEDGQIFSDRSYDDIKQERMKGEQGTKGDG